MREREKEIEIERKRRGSIERVRESESKVGGREEEERESKQSKMNFISENNLGLELKYIKISFKKARKVKSKVITKVLFSKAIRASL